MAVPGSRDRNDASGRNASPIFLIKSGEAEGGGGGGEGGMKRRDCSSKFKIFSRSKEKKAR